MNKLAHGLIVCIAASFIGCSDDQPTNNSTVVDAGMDAAEQPDDSGTSDDGGTVDDAGGDAGGEEGCLQASVTGDWNLTLFDDVSVEYSALVSPEIEGDERVISLLFERYQPGPDVGEFDLSEGQDANFGSCAHCVFIRTDGPERAYYVESGILENTQDPYSRRPAFSMTGLRLIEVEVDGASRESTPIEDGRCIEIADFEGEGIYPPSRWTCPDTAYNDDTECNCDCGDVDPDCGLQNDCVLGDPNCTPSEPYRLPVIGCNEGEVCAFEPAQATNACTESCDREAGEGCSAGTCVFDSGGDSGDLCIADNLRVALGVGIGDECPDTGFQVVCNVIDGFAEGYCGANGTCRSLCTSNDECTETDQTCRQFTFDDPLGYCGPEPVDG